MNKKITLIFYFFCIFITLFKGVAFAGPSLSLDQRVVFKGLSGAILNGDAFGKELTPEEFRRQKFLGKMTYDEYKRFCEVVKDESRYELVLRTLDARIEISEQEGSPLGLPVQLREAIQQSRQSIAEVDRSKPEVVTARFKKAIQDYTQRSSMSDEFRINDQLFDRESLAQGKHPRFGIDLTFYPSIVRNFFTDIFTHYYTDLMTPERAQAIVAGSVSALGEQLVGNESAQKYQQRVLSSVLQSSGPALQKMIQLLGDSGGSSDENVLSQVTKEIKNQVQPMTREDFELSKGNVLTQLEGDSTQSEISKLEIEDQHLAAATVGQVHRCKYQKGGEAHKGVIKFLRPGTESRLEADINFFKARAEQNPMFAQYAQEIEDSLRPEVDLKSEFDKLQRGKKVYEDKHKGFHVAGGVAYLEGNGTKAIVMEQASGKTLNDLDKELDFAIRCYNHKFRSGSIQLSDQEVNSCDQMSNPLEVLKDLADTNCKKGQKLSELYGKWLKEALFGSGFFHGDPHGGNLFFDKSSSKGSHGSLTLIDFGNAPQMSTTERKEMIDFMIGISTSSVKTVLSAFKQPNPKDFDQPLSSEESLEKLLTENQEAMEKLPPETARAIEQLGAEIPELPAVLASGDLAELQSVGVKKGEVLKKFIQTHPELLKLENAAPLAEFVRGASTSLQPETPLAAQERKLRKYKEAVDRWNRFQQGVSDLFKKHGSLDAMDVRMSEIMKLAADLKIQQPSFLVRFNRGIAMLHEELRKSRARAASFEGVESLGIRKKCKISDPDWVTFKTMLFNAKRKLAGIFLNKLIGRDSKEVKCLEVSPTLFTEVAQKTKTTRSVLGRIRKFFGLKPSHALQDPEHGAAHPDHIGHEHGDHQHGDHQHGDHQHGDHQHLQPIPYSN